MRGIGSSAQPVGDVPSPAGFSGHPRGLPISLTAIFAATAFIALAACSSGQLPNAGVGTTSALAPATSTLAAPTIWQQPSASINPKALPLLDQYYATDAPKKGYVYPCDVKMFKQSEGVGSQQNGPWINTAAGTYDMTAKAVFEGQVYWSSAQFAVTTSQEQRVVAGNGLPLGAPTGTFPVPSNDPAYKYDRNPNGITAQAISFSIARNPAPATVASCIYKEVGITLDGVPLHGPLDSTGRDELAYQIQDSCSGAAQPGGGYHRHALSDCTPQIRERNALVGYALDGFGIFTPFDQGGKELTTADLDECHGTTSEIPWEGTTVSMYHYVMTRDFPYTVACFRGTPTRNAFPPLPGAPAQQ